MSQLTKIQKERARQISEVREQKADEYIEPRSGLLVQHYSDSCVFIRPDGMWNEGKRV